MKKIIIIAAAILMTASAFAQDGKSIYNKYSDEAGVSAVYISPAMFRLMGRLPDIEVTDGESFNLGAFVRPSRGCISSIARTRTSTPLSRVKPNI